MPDTLTDLTTPQLDETSFAAIDHDRLMSPAISTHPPRILILYLPRVRLQTEDATTDYDHLSRFSEWQALAAASVREDQK